MEREDIELERFDENGSFRPLTDNYGNTSGEVARLRDDFLKAEKDYFIELLSDEMMYKQFVDLIEQDPEYLFNYAMGLQEQLEQDNIETLEEKEAMKLMTPEDREKFHLKRLEDIEGFICLLLAAIRDKALILTLTHSRRTR